MPTARECAQYKRHAALVLNGADCSCYSCGVFRQRFASLALLEFATRNAR